MPAPADDARDRPRLTWQELRWWLLLLGVAAILRIACVVALATDPRVATPILDGRLYLELAQYLAKGQAWPADPLFITPLYPWILGWVFRVATPSPLTVQVFQSLIGLGTLVLLSASARRDLGQRAAFTLASLYTLTGPILAVESQVLTESLLLFLTCAALLLWPRLEHAWWRRGLFGVVCGLLAIGRGIFLLLPVAAAVHLLLAGRGGAGANVQEDVLRRVRDKGKTSRARRSKQSVAVPARGGLTAQLRSLGMVFLGLGVALFPLAVHQTRTLGSPQLLTLNGGLNLYIGNNAMSKGVYNLPSELDLESDFTARRAASRLAGTDLTLAQSSQFWSKRALDYLTDHPGDWFRLSVRKAMLFFSPREIPQIEDFQILRERHLFLKLALIDFRWILPLALLGCLARLRWPWGRLKATAPQGVAGVVLGPWLILIAVGWLSTMVFFATGRYRIPFLAGFLGLAAAGFLDLMDGVRAHRFRPHLVVLPLAVMFQLLLPGYSAAKACAYDHEQAGLRFVRAGNASASLEEYRQATQIDPDDGLAWHGMGVALVRLNRLPEAAESYRQAARRLSQSASTHYNLGIVYARMGQDSGALVELQEAVRLDPFDVRIRSDMAVALARLGREADAEQAVRQVLGQNPSYAPALRLLRELGQSR